MHINWIGKSSELKLHWFCLFDAYSMPKDIYSVHIWVYIYSAIIIENMTQHFIQTYYGCIHKSHGELSLLVKDTKFTFRLDSVAIKKKG